MIVNKKFLKIVKHKKLVLKLFLPLLLIIFTYFFLFPKSYLPGTIKVYDRNNILLYESSNGLGKNEIVDLDNMSGYMIKGLYCSRG
jgi:hypothetical protein